jgi:ribosome biogenesis protein SSF1/2
MRVTFRDMFPALSVNQINLADCRRVVLFQYDAQSDTIEFRHYVINTAPVGLNKSIKRVVQNKVGDLSKFQDIADYVLSGTGDAESDVEDDGSSHVSVPKTTSSSSSGNKGSSQTKSIRLQEIGPRMRLQLIKIEEQLCTGTVWYHKFVQKTPEEKEALELRKAQQKALKEARKKEQAERLEKKKGSKGKGKNGEADGSDVEEDYEYAEGEKDDQDLEEEQHEAENENVEWFRREVGEEPDEETKEALKAVKVDKEQKIKGYDKFKKKGRDGDGDGDSGRDRKHGGNKHHQHSSNQESKSGRQEQQQRQPMKKRKREDEDTPKKFKKSRSPNKKFKKF